MEISRTLVAPCSTAELFAHVDDLSRYPVWMALVHDVEASEPSAEGALAWTVELRAKVGPFARSKRLRMARTLHAAPRRVVFERSETDGRSHAPWVLEATVEELAPTSAQLTMTLTYGGSLWTGAVLQRVLDDQVRRGSEALVALVSKR